MPTTDPLMTGTAKQLPADKLHLFSLRSRLLLALCFVLIAFAWFASLQFPQVWPRGEYFQGARVHLWAGRVIFEYANVSGTAVAGVDTRLEGYGGNPLLVEKEGRDSLRQKIANAYGTLWTTEVTLSFRSASWRNLFGFHYMYVYWGIYVLVVPIWSFALLPIGWMMWQWLRHRRYKRRLNAGLCAACGYDLRASPGRCPECGRANHNVPTPSSLHAAN